MAPSKSKSSSAAKRATARKSIAAQRTSPNRESAKRGTKGSTTITKVTKTPSARRGKRMQEEFHIPIAKGSRYSCLLEEELPRAMPFVLRFAARGLRREVQAASKSVLEAEVVGDGQEDDDDEWRFLETEATLSPLDALKPSPELWAWVRGM